MKQCSWLVAMAPLTHSVSLSLSLSLSLPPSLPPISLICFPSSGLCVHLPVKRGPQLPMVRSPHTHNSHTRYYLRPQLPFVRDVCVGGGGGGHAVVRHARVSSCSREHACMRVDSTPLRAPADGGARAPTPSCASSGKKGMREGGWGEGRVQTVMTRGRPGRCRVAEGSFRRLLRRRAAPATAERWGTLPKKARER